MATLYWGGGAGTWSAFTTGNWYTDFARTTLSTRSPCSTDDVIFDSASNATGYTVTISNPAPSCKSLTVSGPLSGTLTFTSSGALYIYGNISLPATGLSISGYSGAIYLVSNSSQTITSNGNTWNGNTFNFIGTGTYTLQDAFSNAPGAITLCGVTLNTNGKNFTVGNIYPSISPITGSVPTGSTLTLGASTVSCSSILNNYPYTLTINAGTSNITCTSDTPTFNYTGAVTTWYNVTFSSTNLNYADIYGTNTFNNLTFPATTIGFPVRVRLYGNMTVNGTLTVTGNGSINRYFLCTNKTGATRTLTVAAKGALTDVDFMDITVAGASSPWSGTRLGDCGGNTNITFPAAKTVYWNLGGGGPWTSNAWATSSGGSQSLANFPLAQDTAVIDSTGLGSGFNIDPSNGGTFNLKTLTITNINGGSVFSAPLYLYGDLTCTNSLSPTGAIYFQGRVTQNVTNAGNANGGQVFFTGYNASVSCVDAWTMGSTFYLYSGGFNTNNKTVTINDAGFDNTDDGRAFTLTLGTSTFTCNGNFAQTTATGAAFTVSAGTSTIRCTEQFGISGQTLTWYNVTLTASPGNYSIYGTNTFNNLTFPSLIFTGAYGLGFEGNNTVSGTLNFGGGTAANCRVNVYGGLTATTAGLAQKTLTVATVSGLTNVDFRDIAVAGASAPWSGTRLGNCGNNTNITFAAGVNKYWNLTGTQNWYSTGWALTSGGAPAANNFPLAQDTCIFNNAGAATTITQSLAYNIGTIDMSARTNAMTFSMTGDSYLYGTGLTFGSGVTVSGSGGYRFCGYSTQTLTSAGKTITNTIYVYNPSCVFRHGDAYTSSGSISVANGSYSTQNYNVSINDFASNGTGTRTVDLGTSTLTCSGTSVITINSQTNLTFNATLSTIISTSAASNRLINITGGVTFGTVKPTVGTATSFTILGSNTFGTLTNTAYSYLLLQSGTTQTITNFTYTGASGSVVRAYSSTVPGTAATIKTAINTLGANSTDGGNNPGWSFTGTTPNYLYARDLTYASTVTNNAKFLMFFQP